MLFFIRIFISPYPHKPDSHILDKSFPKKIFCKEVQLYCKISLLSFIHKVFEQNFYLYAIVCLVRIWTFKNADEKAHTFSRSKNGQKRTKNGYCVNSPKESIILHTYIGDVYLDIFRGRFLLVVNYLCF